MGWRLLDEFDGGNGVLVGVNKGETHSRERLEGREDDDDDGVEGECVIGGGRKWWRRLEMG
jgi:hypothetical protein